MSIRRSRRERQITRAVNEATKMKWTRAACVGVLGVVSAGGLIMLLLAAERFPSGAAAFQVLAVVWIMAYVPVKLLIDSRYEP